LQYITQRLGSLSVTVLYTTPMANCTTTA